MNADFYVKVLEEHMLNFLRIHGSEMFIHDSAPSHKAKEATRFLEQQKINVLEWQWNSPDLNPIENYCQKMKNTMSEKKIPNLDTLKEELKKAWCLEMTPSYFRNLSDSTRKRLQLVIKNKGNMTKY